MNKHSESQLRQYLVNQLLSVIESQYEYLEQYHKAEPELKEYWRIDQAKEVGARDILIDTMEYFIGPVNEDGLEWVKKQLKNHKLVFREEAEDALFREINPA